MMGNKLPYLDGALKLHVKTNSVRPDDWLEHATTAMLAEVHSDCMASLLCTGSADVAATLLSNIGHTVVIRVILNAPRPRIGEPSTWPSLRKPYRRCAC